MEPRGELASVEVAVEVERDRGRSFCVDYVRNGGNYPGRVRWGGVEGVVAWVKWFKYSPPGVALVGVPEGKQLVAVGCLTESLVVFDGEAWGGGVPVGALACG